MELANPLARILPATDRDNLAYWTGGRQGQLLIHRCADCATYVHPPVPFCPACEGSNVSPTPVSGRGRIASFTVNHKQWVPDLPVPYVLALVTLVEQDDVRVVANITHCEPEAVQFDMPVEVWFERHEDLWVPLFRPAETAA
jgi:uncharacterized OB-fold protein